MEGDKRSFKKPCFIGVLIGVLVTIGVIWLFEILKSNRSHASSNKGVASLSLTNDLNGALIRKVPDFIIIGVRKGGTKALIDMLNSHPQIVSAKGEVHFFDKPDRYNSEDGMNWYINRMPLAHKGELVVEKSPSYFVVPEAPKRMVESLPRTLKLILIVRNPVTRSVSDYTQLDAKRNHRNKIRLPFEAFAFNASGGIRTSKRVISDSLYDVHYKRWLQYFKPSQFLIVDGDQIISSPLGELKRVEKFLNVKSYFTPDKLYFNETKGFYCWKLQNDSSECLGSFKGRTHPKLSTSTENKLVNFFHPHMVNFCTTAHINFSLCHL